MLDGSQGQPRRINAATLLALLALGLALALRLWGICFSGSTPRGRPDEEIWLIEAMRSLDPAAAPHALDLGYPDGMVLLFRLLLRAEAFALRVAAGREVNLGCVFAVNPLGVVLLPRLFAALSSTAACWAVGATARRLVPVEVRGEAFALGALALGCNYLSGRDGHFGGADALLSFCVALSLLFFVRAALEGPRFLLAGAAMAGAGFGVKFSAAALVVPALVAAGACLRRAGARRWRAFSLCLLALPAAVLGFALVSPGVLAHPGALVASLLGQLHRYAPSARSAYLLDTGAETPPGFVFHALVTLPAAFGILGLVAAIAGLALAARADGAAALVLAAAVAAFFAQLAPSTLLFVRYASPLCPPLAAALGVALSWILLAARSALVPRRAALTAAMACALILGPPLRRLIQFDSLLSHADTRDVARDWLLAQGASASVISQGFYAEHVHAIEPGAASACRAALPGWLYRETPLLPRDAHDWPALVAGGRLRWAEIANESLWQKIAGQADPRAGRFVAQASALLECGRTGRRNWGPLDPGCFHLAVELSPGHPACGSYVDLFDSFFVPFSAFAGQERPGPEIRIYRNVCLR